jgi:Protein of unknown function (DUF789)
MHDELQFLSKSDPSPFLPLPSALFSAPLDKIHPCSWFAVWWQPLYRIPDMPLDVKFLAYYSFESLYQLCSVPHTRRKQSYEVPIAGLLCGGVQAHSTSGEGDEHWLRPRIVDNGSHLSGDLLKEETGSEQAFMEEVRLLHTAAQQLTCDIQQNIVYLHAAGHECEEDAHKDFAFLQRGRLGSLG